MLDDELHRLFRDPPRHAGPTPLWWWSGATVTADRLAWQMRRLDEGGIHDLVVINLAPAGPLFGRRADDPLWFGQTWWDRFEQTCEIARERGMRVWFYDQIGFSGANLQGSITHDHPEAQGRALRSRPAVVEGGRVVLRADEVLVGAYRHDDARRLEHDAAGAVAAADGTEVRLVGSVRTAFDYLDQDAVRLLIDRVHGEYERRMPEMLGTVIPGSFQDELPATNGWTHRFPEEFAARAGYDLLDELPALFTPGGDRAAKVRGDYYRVRTALAEDAFFAPLAEWHRERGMVVGADQSNPARAGFPTQSTQIYSDYFRTHRWYGALGNDHEGDSKVSSSLAHLYGHDHVWLEAFHSSGWGGTLEETWDWLIPFFRSGATLYNPHATYFGTAGGWFEWAPPSTDWRQPYWAQYPAFAKAVSRLSSILTWGGFDAEVALLHPTAVAQAGVTLDLPIDHFGDGRLDAAEYREVDAAQETYLELSGSNNWFLTRSGELDRAGVAYDVVDDGSVQRAGVRDGALHIGRARFRAVVLPAAVVLEAGTARALLELLDDGGRVIAVGALPRFAAGLHADDGPVIALAQHRKLERATSAAAAAEALRDARGHVRSDVPVLSRSSGDDWVCLVPGAHPSASGTRRTAFGPTLDWSDGGFDRDRYARDRQLEVLGRVVEAECWDPASGERLPVSVEHTDGGSLLRLRTGGAPAILVVWRESSDETVAAAAAPPPNAAGAVQRLEGGWTGSLVPTLDNTWGDLALPQSEDVESPQIWNVEWRESPETRWDTVKATYGQSAAVLGPVPLEEVPLPLAPGEVAEVLAGRRPLAGSSWQVARFSAARGQDGVFRGGAGMKGVVPEEFVRVPRAAAGERVVVRTLIECDRADEADLVVLAGARKEVWWNGRSLGRFDGNVAITRVAIERPLNLLEYVLEPPGSSDVALGVDEETFSTGFSIFPPGAFATRPVFMTAPVGLGGAPVFVRDLVCAADARAATIVVGAAWGLSVLIDGEVVARQEKVAYYEGEWGARPSYFSHDVAARLVAGRHTLEIRLDEGAPTAPLYVDLVARTGAGPAVLTSGAGWRIRSGSSSARSLERLGAWEELAAMHAAPRGHLLHDAHWLAPAPVVGALAVPFRATTSATPATQELRFTVPSGTTRLEVPLAVEAEVLVDGDRVDGVQGVHELLRATERPAVVVVRTAPTTTRRGGAALTGPIRVTARTAPIELGEWASIGLGTWSGGVRYERDVDFGPVRAAFVLDLGDLRGSIRVEVDGTTVAERFCAPFRVDLGPRRGRGRVAITVSNTLGPFLRESTPTSYVSDGQLRSGLLGPVTLTAGSAQDGIRDR